MKIKSWNDEYIFFTDGSTISYQHEPDCCEYNWADFSILDVFYQQEEFVNFDIIPVEEYGFLLSLELEKIASFGDKWYYDYTPTKKIFIPCYSDQNGYYSTQLTIVVHRPDAKGLKLNWQKEYPLFCEMRIH